MFEAVVFTMPVPQFLGDTEFQPVGDYLTALSSNAEILNNLNKVKYNSVYTLGLVYEKPLVMPVTWTDKYFPGHPIIRYASITAGRNGETRLVVQSHRSWAEARLNSLTKEDSEPVLLAALKVGMDRIYGFVCIHPASGRSQI